MLAQDHPDLAPFCGEAEFAELLDGMVTDEAPRLFAVVQVFGERADGRIAAWGLAFEEHARVVSESGGTWMRLRAPENAIRLFTVGDHVRAHLVWPSPDAAELSPPRPRAARPSGASSTPPS